jgi:DNA-binding IscR family transcriptional regulator
MAAILPPRATATAECGVTFAVSRADPSFRSWLQKYEMTDLVDERHFYPTNRHAAAAFRQESL